MAKTAFNLSILAGIFIAASFTALTSIPAIQGAYIPIFITLFFLASGGYLLALFRLNVDQLSLPWIWGFAVIFRVVILFTPLSLSDDVYRYMWDGHLLNSGINPYAFPVNSELLNAFEVPVRSLINHDWMVSPYLPVPHFIYAIVEFVFSQSVLAFRLTAVVFDLLSGWIVLKILRRVKLPGQNSLIYLWNPLIIIEFSQGAHLDSILIFFMILAFWLVMNEPEQFKLKSLGSPISLAAATLTKITPILLAPIFWWNWDWKKRLVFFSGLIVVVGIFVPGAGLGLFGHLDGSGVFGALRIYLQRWNFNSGIYHWLEIWISGYSTPGAVPAGIVGSKPIYLAKFTVTLLLGLAILITYWLAWKSRKANYRTIEDRYLYQLRLAVIPLTAYLLLTTTVHPWYVTHLIPFLSFFFPADTESPAIKKFFWSGIYLSLAVILSYLTYLDPDNLSEIGWVRLVEYIPVYGFLVWAGLHVMIKSKKTRHFPL